MTLKIKKFEIKKKAALPFSASALKVFRSGLLCALILPSAGFAADIDSYSGRYFYRYVDDSGETVIATQVPRLAARRGYEVLTDTGRVLEVVDPELSEEARQAQAFLQQLRKQQQARAEREAQEDSELLRLYASVEDVERSLQRVLEEIDDRIAVIKGSIQRSQIQYEQKQSRAAEMERSGRKVPDNLLVEMQNFLKGQEAFQRQMDEFYKEKDQTRAIYGMRKARVEKLLHGEKVLDQNASLEINSKGLVGQWQPASKNDELVSWSAQSDGEFVLIRKNGRNMERWQGTWTLKPGNNLVVIYTRKEVTRAGKTSREAFAREERYPIMDSIRGDLYLFWDDAVVRFQRKAP